jgi:hypothetical protein
MDLGASVVGLALHRTGRLISTKSGQNPPSPMTDCGGGLEMTDHSQIESSTLTVPFGSG